MLTTDFDYDLPTERIAQFPVPRGQSRLLTLDGAGHRAHHRIAELPDLLRAGDLLVVNNTKVIPARLFAQRQDTGGRLELLLTEKLTESDWLALVKPGRRAHPGSRFDVDEELELEIVTRRAEGMFHLRFNQPIEPHLDRLGHVPLPPYIRRADRQEDRCDYQTLFASRPGAVAAPTAGLHFNQTLLSELEGAEIQIVEITLHVGIGTFKPVSAHRVADHTMEPERYEISPATATAIQATRESGSRVVAVGTTVVRTLEAVAREQGRVAPASGRTDLFITPGFEFQVVDSLLTNFHLPRSTLLMLVCAFAGRESVMAAYAEAIAHGYRFYSYGDAMLLER